MRETSSTLLLAAIGTLARKPLPLVLTCLLHASCLPARAQTPVQPTPVVPLQGAPRAEKAKAQFQQVMGQLPDPYYPDPNEEPWAYSKAGALVDGGWKLAGAWVTSYLGEHPTASADELVAEANALSYEAHGRRVSVEASAAQLGSGRRSAYVVAVNAEVTGTFFVVARQADGHFRVVWSIKEEAKRDPRGELGWWASLAQAPFINGPLTGTVRQLPPSRRGLPRFYVDAQANPMMGSTIPKQISIWEWRRSKAVPLLVRSYTSVVEGLEDITFAENLLTMHTKEPSKILSSCGSCTDPEGIWTIRITPDEVTDLGHRCRDPEFPLIDELLYRMANDRPIFDIARPQLARELAPMFPDNEYGKEFDVGPLDQWRASRGRNQTIVDLIADGMGALMFSVERRNDRGFVTGVRLEDFECWTGPAWSGLPLVSALAMPPTNPPVLLAGRGNGGVAKIGDFGERIDLSSMPANDARCIRALAGDPVQPTTVYAARPFAVFRSTDTGATWQRTFSYKSGDAVTASDPVMVVGGSNDLRTVYAGTRPRVNTPDANQPALVKSTDGGSTWIPAGEGLDIGTVFSLAADRSLPPTVYAGTDRGVFKSEDDGGHWHRASAGLSDAPILALAVNPAAPGVIYAGTFGEGVFKSSDGGQTWASVNRGLTETHVNALALTPGDGATIYAGTEPGLFRSTDGAATWNAADASAATAVVLALMVDPNNPKRVYAGTAEDGILLFEAGRP